LPHPLGASTFAFVTSRILHDIEESLRHIVRGTSDQESVYDGEDGRSLANFPRSILMAETVKKTKKTKAAVKDSAKSSKKTTPINNAVAAGSNVTKNQEHSGSNEVKGPNIPFDQVASLAHRFFTERGCLHGHDADDWFRAEQELRAKAS
jgi:hypothetical protein